MKTYFEFDFTDEIPVINKRSKLPDSLNAWISPDGKFYGIEGSKHLRAATFLCIFNLNIGPDDLRKGTYFNETFDSKLLSLGWMQVMDSYWLTGSKNPRFIHTKEASQAQVDIVWDYCEKHNLDYPFNSYEEV